MMNKDDELERNRMARIPREKKRSKAIAKYSKKKIEQMAEEKKLVSSNGDTLMKQWYKARRQEMVGTCQCGCGEYSQKDDSKFFRHSAAHIFPKWLFESVKYHPLNWVERRFWAGYYTDSPSCHSVMDETSMERWPGMADWEDIKAKFHILAPLLTPEEKATNFYTRLEKLVYAN